MDSTALAKLTTDVQGYVASASSLVTTVGFALIGLAFTVYILRKGKRAAGGRI